MHALKKLLVLTCIYAPLSTSCKDAVATSGNKKQLAQLSTSIAETLYSKAPWLAKLERTCQDSQGSWNPILASCLCTSGKLFFVDLGCHRVTLQKIGADARTAHYTISGRRAYIDYPTFSDEGISNASAVDTCVVPQLHGITLPAHASRTSIWVNSEEEDLEEDFDKQGQLIGGTAAWIHRPSESFDLDDNDLENCSDAIHNLDTLVQPQVQQKLCEGLKKAWKVWKNPEASVADSLVDIGAYANRDACQSECHLVLNWQLRGAAVLYHLEMKDYIPIRRAIEVLHGDLHLEILLNGLGKIDRMVYARSTFDPINFTRALRRLSIGPGWSPRKFTDTHEDESAKWLTAIPDGHRLLKRENLDDLDAQDPITIIDHQFDLRSIGLLSHTSAESCPNLACLLGSEGDGVFAELDQAERARLSCQGHGSALASIVVRGLPNIKFSILPELMSTDFETMTSLWRNHLKRNRPKVVIIAHGAQRFIADCHKVYGSLFNDFPGILFLAAAGNEGVREPTAICPAGLATTYPNLLSVAATTNGVLDPASNYGRNSVSLAASIDGRYAIGLPGSVYDDVRSGTSSAVSEAANIALRLSAKHPHLHGSALASKLMELCDDSGIAVACGGILQRPDDSGREETKQ